MNPNRRGGNFCHMQVKTRLLSLHVEVLVTNKLGSIHECMMVVLWEVKAHDKETITDVN